MMEEHMTDTTQSPSLSSPSQSSPLQSSSLQFSEHLAAIVAAAARSVVAVYAGTRRPSSGMVWQPGIAVCAEETVDRDTDIWLTLPDGRRVEATLAGRDPTTDIAVLRFAESSAAPAALAATPFAAGLRPGHLALAVGRADGDVIAAHGMIALSGPAWRSSQGGLIDARLRIDVNLPGAAQGGALLAIDGSLIGMAVFGPRRRVLAIPAVTIGRFVQSIKDTGHIARGYLGVGLQHVPLAAGDRTGGDRTADDRTLPRRGAMVVTLDPAGPAYAAGILQGDIIVTLGGTEVTGLRSIYRELGPDAVGQAKPVNLIRAGARTTVEVVIGARPQA
jgi:S1-C subfamily serine protease